MASGLYDIEGDGSRESAALQGLVRMFAVLLVLEALRWRATTPRICMDRSRATPHNSEPQPPRPVKHLELKAALLLVFTALLMAGSVLYLLYARGVFERHAEAGAAHRRCRRRGGRHGHDLFRLSRSAGCEGWSWPKTAKSASSSTSPQKDAHWLRTTSVFTLVRGLVGGTAIRAFSGMLTDPPLPDGAERPVLRGDATAEMPRVLATAREVLENVNAMTAQDAALRGRWPTCSRSPKS